MNISELTQQEMKEILLKAYHRGNESEIGAKQLIEEIKQEIISTLRRK